MFSKRFFSVRDPNILVASPHIAENTTQCWNYSFSHARSMFTTAVVSKLTSLSPGITLAEAAEDEDYPTEKIETQTEAYHGFHSTIFKTLSRGIDVEEIYQCEPGSLIKQVRQLGQLYLNSYSNFNDTGDDGPLHNLIRRIIHGHETDDEQLERACLNITYRMQQMSIADRYIEALGIPPPLGQQCCEWDAYRHHRTERSGYAIKRMIFDEYEILFPSPVEEQGRPFYKGVDYVVAALQRSGLLMPGIRMKLEELEEMVDAEVEGLVRFVIKDPEIVAKREKLFGLFGEVAGSVSTLA